MAGWIAFADGYGIDRTQVVDVDNWTLAELERMVQAYLRYLQNPHAYPPGSSDPYDTRTDAQAFSQYLLGAYLPTSGPAIESVEKLLEVCSPEEYIRLLADRGMDVGFGAEQPIIAAIGGGIAGIIGGIKNGRGSALGLDKGGKGGGSGGGNSTLIYREGGRSPSNLKARPQDDGMLSFRDSLSNPWPLPEGEFPPLRKEYIVVDTTKLPTGSVIYDNTPPGHVSVRDVPVEVLQKAIVGSGKFPK